MLESSSLSVTLKVLERKAVIGEREREKKKGLKLKTYLLVTLNA